MPRRPALYPRPRWQWATDLPHAAVPWTDLLRLPDLRFVSDNQVSLWAACEKIGAERIWFYPVPRAPHLDPDRYDTPRIMHESIHHIAGPQATAFRDGQPVTWDAIDIAWLPSCIDRTLRAGDLVVSERMTTTEDLVLIWLRPETPVPGVTLHWSAAVERTQTASWRAHGSAHVCLHDDGVANGWMWLGSEVRAWDTHATPGCLTFEADLPPEGVLLVLMVGYDQAAVERRLEALIAQIDGKATSVVGEELSEKAREAWDWFFTKMVPGFRGAPEWVTRLYYYYMASHRLNLYDIPYEPFIRPYTCPWKTGAVWQWAWNTPMNSIAERWLNDPSWAESGVELMRENGGALNIGASLHRLRKPRQFRDVNEYLTALRDAQEGSVSLPATARQFDWAFIMPPTTPLGVHGVWEIFQRTGDEEYLHRHLPDMIEYEAMLSGHDPDGDGLVDFHGMVDEYDYALRWRSVVPGYKKGTESLVKFDRPLEMIDINAQLCLLREDIEQAAELFGDRKLARRIRQRREKTTNAINALLWDEARGCYRDVDSRTHAGTGVFSVAAFSALLAGVVPEDRAARMVALLDDPNAFGAPYPVPSVMMDTPGVDPGLVTYGGDVLLTSGVWTTVLGLVRYGYLDKAREIIWRVLEMVGADGPTSSYSYHSITGQPNQDRHTFASQAAIMLDLLIRYVVGFIPRSDDIIECWPFALPAEWEHVQFGPVVWRGDVDVTIIWDRAEGYTVRAGRSTFTTPEPRHLWLGLDQEDNLVELPDPSVFGQPVMA